MTVHRITWNELFNMPCQNGALTIGNFDGVHRGHQALLAELRKQADVADGPAVVLTLDPHPEQLLRPQSMPHLLTTMEQRADLLQQHGADHVLILQTTRELLQIRARHFFEQMIRDRIRPKTLVPGFNFRFGHNREGGVDTLEEYCRDSGMHFVLLRPTLHKDETISSSRTRAALHSGNVALAAELLGRPYALTGVVVEGQRRGQTIGFPTANVDGVATLIPANGVYAVRVFVNGAPWTGAANIGPNPTFNEETRKIEIHIIDFDGDLYGMELTVEFVDKLRDTKKFASVDALVTQLQQDVKEARIRVYCDGKN